MAVDPDRLTSAGRAVLQAAGQLEPLTAEVARRSQQRRRLPWWILPVVLFLPVWGVLYAQSLSESPNATATPLDAGAQVYAVHPAGLQADAVHPERACPAGRG